MIQGDYVQKESPLTILKSSVKIYSFLHGGKIIQIC